MAGCVLGEEEEEEGEMVMNVEMRDFTLVLLLGTMCY